MSRVIPAGRHPSSYRYVNTVDARAAELAREQFGVVGRKQLTGLGMSNRMIRHRVATGRLAPVHPAAFLVNGAPDTWHARLMAAHLWLGDRSFVSHRSAARLYELEGYQGVRRLELTLAGTGRVRLAGVGLHRSKTIRPQDGRRIGPFVCTGPERLLLDLAACVSPRMLEVAFDSVLFKGLSTYGRVRSFLQEVRASGLNGVTALATLLDGRRPDDAPAESFFESDFYRFLRDSEHNDGVYQYEVFDGGGRIGRLDVAFPANKVGVEVHSTRWHSSAQQVRRDAERHNRLTAAGWRILYETYDNLKSKPHEILERLDALLRSSPAPDPTASPDFSSRIAR